MKRYIPTVALALFLMAGCAGDPALESRKALILACDGWATSLDQLTIRKAQGNLSAEQIVTVDEWRPVLNGFCADTGVVVDIDGALAKIREGLIEMQLEEARQ